jgi:hypothetical protein
LKTYSENANTFGQLFALAEHRFNVTARLINQLLNNRHFIIPVPVKNTADFVKSQTHICTFQQDFIRDYEVAQANVSQVAVFCHYLDVFLY